MCAVSRPIDVEIGVLREADGSCAYSIGSTRVLAAVYGPKSKGTIAVRGNQYHDDDTGLQITCTATISSMASGSAMRGGGDSSLASLLKPDHRSLQLEQLIIDTIRPVAFLRQYPQSNIAIHVQVIQDDGGAEAAAINGVSVALQEAAISMKDIVVACSVATSGRQLLRDPTKRELTLSSGDALYVTIAQDTASVLSIKMNRKTNEIAINTVVGECAQACDDVKEVMFTSLRKFHEQKLAPRLKGGSSGTVDE